MGDNWESVMRGGQGVLSQDADDERILFGVSSVEYLMGLVASTQPQLWHHDMTKNFSSRVLNSQCAIGSEDTGNTKVQCEIPTNASFDNKIWDLRWVLHPLNLTCSRIYSIPQLINQAMGVTGHAWYEKSMDRISTIICLRGSRSQPFKSMSGRTCSQH